MSEPTLMQIMRAEIAAIADRDNPQVRLYFGPAAAAFVRRQYPGTDVIEVKPIPVPKDKP